MIKNTTMNTKYIWLLLTLIAFTACDSDDDSIDNLPEPLPALTAGEANFSNYVAIGGSLSAGFTDGALFQAGQVNSLPNILAQQFDLAEGGSFSQPLMNDNVGGLLLGGAFNARFGPRLIFDGSGPAVLPATSSTEATTVVSGPFNNMGVPGAKIFHLLFDGYGNPGNISLELANPYFVRMASSPTTTVLADAVAQSPTFFSLWMGNNDVLGYATSGGDGSNPITDVTTFTGAYNLLISTLAAGGTQGVVGNIPDVRALPHFTTVPYAPLDPTNPGFGPLIPTLNATFGQLNQVFDALNVPERKIVFAVDAASPVVVKDESLTDLSAQITGALQLGGADAQTAGLLGFLYGQARQANENDLLVLPSSSIIGELNTDAFAFLTTTLGVPPAQAGQLSVNGVTYPLEDKWVLIPSEQADIATATSTFNTIIKDAADAAGLAFVDANYLMNQLAGPGLGSGDFILTSALVQGGAFSLDGVHPTARGYSLLANEFLKAIDTRYGSNFEASGNILNIGEFPTSYPANLP